MRIKPHFISILFALPLLIPSFSNVVAGAVDAASPIVVGTSKVELNSQDYSANNPIILTTNGQAVTNSTNDVAIVITLDPNGYNTIILDNIDLTATAQHAIIINGSENCTIKLSNTVKVTASNNAQHAVVYTGSETLTISGAASDDSHIGDLARLGNGLSSDNGNIVIETDADNMLHICGNNAIYAKGDISINGAIGTITGENYAIKSDSSVFFHSNADVSTISSNGDVISVSDSVQMDEGSRIKALRSESVSGAGVYAHNGEIQLAGTITDGIFAGRGLCAAGASLDPGNITIRGTIGTISATADNAINSVGGDVILQTGASIGEINSLLDGLHAGNSLQLETGATIRKIISTDPSKTGIYASAGDITIDGTIPEGVSGGFGICSSFGNVYINGTIGAIRANDYPAVTTGYGNVTIAGHVASISSVNSDAVSAVNYAILDYGDLLDTATLSPTNIATVSFECNRAGYIGPVKGYFSNRSLQIPLFSATYGTTPITNWYTERNLQNSWDFTNTIDNLPANDTLYSGHRYPKDTSSNTITPITPSTTNVIVNKTNLKVPCGTHGLPEVKLNSSDVQRYRVTGDQYVISAPNHKGMLLDIDLSARDLQALVLKSDSGIVSIPANTLIALRAEYGDTLRLLLSEGGIKVALLNASYQEIDARIAMPYTITLPYAAENPNSNTIVAVETSKQSTILPFALYRNSESTFHVSSPGAYYLIENEKYFSDITGHWALREIDGTTARELFLGTDANLFSPDTSMTRAMFVTVLWRLDGRPSATANTTFNDVETDAWYEKAVAWAAENGILMGYGNSNFGPHDAITREQMTAVLQNYIAYSGITLQISQLYADWSDVHSISPWATKAAFDLQRTNMIQGLPNGSFNPKGLTSRAEAATIFMRLIDAAQ